MNAVTSLYQRSFTPMEFVCEGCGAKFRVDFECVAGSFSQPFAAQEYQHCDKDERRYGPPIIAIWEERDGKWFRLEDGSQ